MFSDVMMFDLQMSSRDSWVLSDSMRILDLVYSSFGALTSIIDGTDKYPMLVEISYYLKQQCGSLLIGKMNKKEELNTIYVVVYLIDGSIVFGLTLSLCET